MASRKVKWEAGTGLHERKKGKGRMGGVITKEKKTESSIVGGRRRIKVATEDERN